MIHPEQAKSDQQLGEVLRYLAEKCRRNSDYLEDLMDDIWKKAPLEERVTVLAVQSMLAPQDPEMKEAYAKACLFEKYIASGQAYTDMLEDMSTIAMLEASLQMESGPPETEPPYPDAA